MGLQSVLCLWSLFDVTFALPLSPWSASVQSNTAVVSHTLRLLFVWLFQIGFTLWVRVLSGLNLDLYFKNIEDSSIRAHPAISLIVVNAPLPTACLPRMNTTS